MKISKLFEKVRVLIRDEKYNSNSSRSDQFYSDDDLIGHFNMALVDFDFKTNYNRVIHSEVDYQITTVASTQIYDLPAKTLRVFDLRVLDEDEEIEKKMNETLYEVECVLNEQVVETMPEWYQLDYKDKKIRVMPIPDKEYIIKMRGVVSSEFYTTDDVEEELPLPEKYHEYFKYYIAARCLEIAESDNQNFQIVQFMDGKFDQFCRQVKLEVSRRSADVVITHNGQYNAW